MIYSVCPDYAVIRPLDETFLHDPQIIFDQFFMAEVGIKPTK